VRPGRRLAIDVGKARIGLALSDASGILASPLATLPRLESDSQTIEAVVKQVADYDIVEIYVGLPIGLSGQNTQSTGDAIAIAELLEQYFACSVRLIDERLTTVSATANLRQHGISAKNQRMIIDQEAAALILENALKQERVQGTPPGRTISEL
jgi:putative Holliday junction resolvase